MNSFTPSLEQIIGDRRERTERYHSQRTLQRVCRELKERGIQADTAQTWMRCLYDKTPCYLYRRLAEKRYLEEWKAKHADPQGFWVCSCGRLFSLDEPSDHNSWRWISKFDILGNPNDVWIEKDHEERNSWDDQQTWVCLLARVYPDEPDMSIVARKIPATRILEMMGQVMLDSSFIPGEPTEIKWMYWEYLYC